MVRAMSPRASVSAFAWATSVPARREAFTMSRASENTSGTGSLVSRTTSDSMHHRMMFATSVPSWAHAFASPPASFQMRGRATL